MKKRVQLFLFVTLLLVLLAACAPAATPAPTAPAIAVKPASALPEGITYTEPCTPAKSTGVRADGKLRLVIATGNTGGIFFPYGGGLARLFTEKLANAEATAEVTGGSVDNMKLIQVNDADLGMSTVDSAYDARTGAGAYQETGAVEACALAVLYTSFVHVVARQESGIGSVADMKGRRVSVGSGGSSSEVAADRILRAAGLDPHADIIRDNLSAVEAVASMKDQKIDAFFWASGLPTPAITDLVATPNLPLTFIDTSAVVEQLRAQYGPVYTPFTLRQATYAGLTADVPGIGIGNILFVNAAMPVGLVYQLLDTIFTNLDEVHTFHPEAQKLRLETATVGSSIPFHSGAIQFYHEKGVWTGAQ